jgi:Xaa-Pro aminopeptidase
MDQFERAKELFVLYHGNTLQMYRAGVLEQYKHFDVQQPAEKQWFEELVEKYTKELSIRDWTAADNLAQLASSYKDKAILENVVSFVSRHLMSSDSIVKLMYAERIIEIVKRLKKEIAIELVHKAYKAAAIILEDIMIKPLIVDPGHELANYNLTDKKSLNNRAKKSIEEIKNDLN